MYVKKKNIYIYIYEGNISFKEVRISGSKVLILTIVNSTEFSGTYRLQRIMLVQENAISVLYQPFRIPSPWSKDSGQELFIVYDWFLVKRGQI